MKLTVKRILFCCGLLIASLGQVKAEFGLHFDKNGDIIYPDDYYLAKGLINYQQGYLNHAETLITKAAKYGNNVARYYLARIKLNQKKWPESYAWLKLTHAGTMDVDEIRDQVNQLISNKEKVKGEKIYQQLKEKFDDIAGLKRRDRWKKSIRLTGTHVGGGKPIGNLKIAGQYDGEVVFKKIDNYIDNYEINYGHVELKDFEVIDEETDTDQDADNKPE